MIEPAVKGGMAGHGEHWAREEATDGTSKPAEYGPVIFGDVVGPVGVGPLVFGGAGARRLSDSVELAGDVIKQWGKQIFARSCSAVH
jgi:hypothetical protein